MLALRKCVFYIALSLTGSLVASTLQANDECIDLTQADEAMIDACAVQIEAQQATIAADQTSTFKGNVKLQYQELNIKADQVDYSLSKNQLSANGNVKFATKQIELNAADSHMNVTGQSAVFNNANFSLKNSKPPANGSARSIAITKQIQILNGATYTTCDSNNPAWQITADKIQVNQATSRGIADNVTLKIKNIPVLYLPKLPFPASDKRLSGFLPPIIDNSADKGTEVALPWYWNIAPDYDATITPSIMTDRGFALGSEFRYLLNGTQENNRGHQSKISGQWLANDRQTGDDRYFWNWQHQQRWGSGSDQWLAADIVWKDISDSRYLFDFGRESIGDQQLSEKYLQRHAVLQGQTRNRYFQQNLVVSLNDNRFIENNSEQTLTPKAEYNSRLKLSSNWQWNTRLHTATIDDEESNIAFKRHIGETSFTWNRQNNRFQGEINTGYRWHKQQADSGDHDSATPWFSLGGQTGGYKTFDGGWGHQINLRLKYQYANADEQNSFNAYTNHVALNNWEQLWVLNRYYGDDFFTDSNDISWGLSNTLYNDSGEEFTKLDIGQRIQLSNPEQRISSDSSENNNNDRWLLRSQTRLSKRLSATVEGQWNAASNNWDQRLLEARYQPQENWSLLARWNKPTTNHDEISLATRVKLKNWQASASWSYDLSNDQSLGGNFAFSYNACCWNAGITISRSGSSDPNDNSQLNTYWGLQFELVGLGGISNSNNSQPYQIRRWLY